MKISYGQTMVCGFSEEVRSFLREGQAILEMSFHNNRKQDEIATPSFFWFQC